MSFSVVESLCECCSLQSNICNSKYILKLEIGKQNGLKISHYGMRVNGTV